MRYWQRRQGGEFHLGLCNNIYYSWAFFPRPSFVRQTVFSLYDVDVRTTAVVLSFFFFSVHFRFGIIIIVSDVRHPSDRPSDVNRYGYHESRGIAISFCGGVLSIFLSLFARPCTVLPYDRPWLHCSVLFRKHFRIRILFEFQYRSNNKQIIIIITIKHISYNYFDRHRVQYFLYPPPPPQGRHMAHDNT